MSGFTFDSNHNSLELLREVAGEVFTMLARARTVNVARERFNNLVSTWQIDIPQCETGEERVVVFEEA